MPVFQSTLRERIHAFTLELWDEEAVRMIGWRELRARFR